ncbi:hypothetical protein AC578_6388 [Pseudocercospora eumusae]|uniref:F-box domain-containing protein n=1 Tax=Pseudocercospora eumusae TaxID=321146 RepID=A0A139H0S8_9PEZI|nr:hypothetical protein AC578_6388 [Pseudocercospora eumusae]
MSKPVLNHIDLQLHPGAPILHSPADIHKDTSKEINVMSTAHFDSEQELFEAEETTPKNLMDLFWIPKLGEKILLEMDPADLFSTLRTNRQFKAIVDNSTALQRKMFLAQLPEDNTLTTFDTWSTTPDTAWKPNTILCPATLNDTQLLSSTNTPRRHFVHDLFPHAVLSCEWLHAPVQGSFPSWQKARATKHFTRIFVLRINKSCREDDERLRMPRAGENMFLTDTPTFHFVQILDLRSRRAECEPICPGMRMIDVLELAVQVTTGRLE